MTDLPEPLVPPEVDLRSFAFMPLDVGRLRDADISYLASGDGFRAAVLLWCAAWHQLPAASLPNDDASLARLAGFGRSVQDWLAVRAEGLRGFVLCSDGRLYHPTVAEKAIAAWQKKRSKHAQTAAATAARAARRKQENADEQRNVERDDLRNVDQGEERKERKDKERRPRSARSFDRGSSKPRKHPFPADAFDRWYAAYPLHVGKQDAKKAFAKIEAADDTDFQILIDSVAAYRKTKPEGISFAHPATWLNGRRWEDDPTDKRTAAATSPVIDFRNGMTAPLDTVAACYARHRWPPDWGPRPGEPGCLVPAEHLSTIMERAAA